jgi:hypothetical protein
MNYREVSFNAWFKWKDRDKIENSDQPGVYALCRSDKTPPRSVNPLDHDIVYFGETCAKNGLRQRWKQFDDTAFNHKRGHSGGRTYRKEFPEDKGLNLYVAAMPVLLGNEMANKCVRESFIRFAKRKLILDYAIRWNRLPVCNKR